MRVSGGGAAAGIRGIRELLVGSRSLPAVGQRDIHKPALRPIALSTGTYMYMCTCISCIVCPVSCIASLSRRRLPLSRRFRLHRERRREQPGSQTNEPAERERAVLAFNGEASSLCLPSPSLPAGQQNNKKNPPRTDIPPSNPPACRSLRSPCSPSIQNAGSAVSRLSSLPSRSASNVSSSAGVPLLCRAHFVDNTRHHPHPPRLSSDQEAAGQRSR